MLLVVFL